VNMIVLIHGLRVCDDTSITFLPLRTFIIGVRNEKVSHIFAVGAAALLVACCKRRGQHGEGQSRTDVTALINRHQLGPSTTGVIPTIYGYVTTAIL